MFSFHKPKIYRSNLGCCICKAKSSSSRFTDSKKYENEFERCFRIEEKRSGEICNACVLLVKRWKKLSPENRLTKHWHHVVDARAGPGTKLTGNRRLPGPSSSSSPLSELQGERHSSSSSQKRHSSANNRSSANDVLTPLSSSQTNNTQSASTSASGSSTGGRKRSNSFSKVCAIDTNVSTFTFGEPQRRSYMTVDSSFYSNSSSSGSSLSSSLTKPQSALNSSAFESVIKRFRQRQQQQQLEAQRRLLNRQQRQQKQPNPLSSSQTNQVVNKESSSSSSSSSPPQSSNDEQRAPLNRKPDPESPVSAPQQASNKRQKRSSESIGSLSVDGCRISSLLDPTMWRKEKICCGIIFRGHYNEVVVFPKLLKPCQCRLSKLQASPEAGSESVLACEGDELRSESPQPPPRTSKSGSISSCDSNTSGTGSMEQPLIEDKSNNSTTSTAEASTPSRYLRRKPSTRQATEMSGDDEAFELAGSDQASAGSSTSTNKRGSGSKRPAAMPMTRRKQRKLCDTDSNLSSSSSAISSRKGGSDNVVNSPSSSSGASSTRLLLLAGDEEDEEDDVGQILELEDDLDPESSTDASNSSSVESLGADLEQAKKSNDQALGAMG